MRRAADRISASSGTGPRAAARCANSTLSAGRSPSASSIPRSHSAPHDPITRPNGIPVTRGTDTGRRPTRPVELCEDPHTDPERDAAHHSQDPPGQIRPVRAHLFIIHQTPHSCLFYRLQRIATTSSTSTRTPKALGATATPAFFPPRTPDPSHVARIPGRRDCVRARLWTKSRVRSRGRSTFLIQSRVSCGELIVGRNVGEHWTLGDVLRREND